MQWNGLMKTLEDSKFVQDGYFYPCIDVSPSMMMTMASHSLRDWSGISLFAFVQAQSRIYISSDPEWIQYDPSENFVDRVYKTRNSNWGSTTNIHKMFKKILDTCLASKKNNTKVPQSELDKTCLIIFSDMQFDCHKTQDEEELFRVIRREYKSAGYMITFHFGLLEFANNKHISNH